MSTDEIRRRLDGVIIALAEPWFLYSTRRPFNNGEIAYGPSPMSVIHPDWSLHYAAFGSNPPSKFFCFWDPKSDAYDCSVGEGVPTRFYKWVVERTNRSDQSAAKSNLRNMRVAFGPADSFLAWDRDTVRWGGLPEKLEDLLQTVLSPGNGKAQGRIVHAALGWGGSFYLATADGAVYFSFVTEAGELSKLSRGWANQPSETQSMRRVFLDPLNPMRFVIIEPSRDYIARCPAQDALSHVIDNLYSPEERSLRQQLRSQSPSFVPFESGLQHVIESVPWRHCSLPGRPKLRTSFSDTPPGEFTQRSTSKSGASNRKSFGDFPSVRTGATRPTTKKASKLGSRKSSSFGHGSRYEPYSRSSSSPAPGVAPPKAKKAADASGTNASGSSVHGSTGADGASPDGASPKSDLEAAFENWTRHCDKIFAAKAIAFFPQIPVSSCRCREPRCQTSVARCQLKACRHEVESFLRASGRYSTAWLRRERTKWHPDYFAFRCAPNRRDVLCRTASELFTLFTELIEELELELQKE